MNRAVLTVPAIAILILSTTHLLADEPTIPDTVAGRCASAYVKAFNTGDDDAVRAFEGIYRAASALKERPTDRRVEQYRELYHDWGQLRLRSVESDGELGLQLVIAPAKLDHWLEFDFQMEPESPHGLIGIMIQGPVDPQLDGVGGKPIDAAARERVINRMADELIRAYVFKDVGQKLADAVRKNLADGQYDDIGTVFGLSRRLTDDLQAICHDKHLRVRPRAPRRGPSRGIGPADGPRSAERNYGFVKVEILSGNVGYIKLNGFSGTPDAEPTAAAAMALVANTDALIFDLTENGGGSPNMIAFLSGYLFNERTLLNRFDNRLEGISETWSRDDVPGKHYGRDKPVYVLTSNRTFSAAEEFTYNLKHLKRATIVGKPTGGGAHPVRGHTINKHLTMSVPYARAVNPITGTNWEGVGVIPHVDVPTDQALETAQNLAREAGESVSMSTSTGPADHSH